MGTGHESSFHKLIRPDPLDAGPTPTQRNPQQSDPSHGLIQHESISDFWRR